MLEVLALSSSWDLQDSLSALSDVLPATDEVRSHPYPILNLSYHFDRKQNVATSETGSTGSEGTRAGCVGCF